MNPKLFIVVWDDEQGTSVPMSWDPACKGALYSGFTNDKVAVFPSRRDARTAINISTAYARLLKARGEIYSDDFIGGRECVKVVPLEFKKP